MTSVPEAAETIPPADLSRLIIKRWTPARKARVVKDLELGRLTITDACDIYALSLEEIVSWQRAFERAGIKALRTTHLQHYRRIWHGGAHGEGSAGIGWHRSER